MADLTKINVSGTEYNVKDTTARSGLTGKADKAVPAAAGNLATLDASGNPADSTKSVSDMLDSANHTYNSTNVKAALDEHSTTINQLSYKNVLSSAVAAVITSPNVLIMMPSGFNWDWHTINVYKNGSGVVSTDFDAVNYKPTGGTIYYVKTTGSDSNDGLTPDTALAKLSTAIAKSDFGEAIIYDGYYTDANGFNNTGITKNIRITAASGSGADVTISTFRTLTWSKTVGRTNVYESSRTSVLSVWDAGVLDSFGDYTKLTSVASLDLCDSTVGSYYYATPNLYVHTADSRAADSNIKASLNVKNLLNTGNYSTYLENIKLYGGNDGCAKISTSVSSDSTLFVAKNCQFKYSDAGSGGLSILGADAIVQNCIAARNYADAFNYHSNANRTSRVIEINISGRRSGIGRGGNTDNGSTIHDGGKIIRVNSTFYNCEGPNIHDINSGTQSWNIGANSYDSDATISTRNVNYMAEDGAEMWLDTCIENVSTYSVRVDSIGKIYLRSCTITNGLPQVNGGTIELY